MLDTRLTYANGTFLIRYTNVFNTLFMRLYRSVVDVAGFKTSKGVRILELFLKFAYAF